MQEFLTDQGFYAGPISGNFFLITVEGVKKFQKANGINPTGYFGTKSRAVANQILSNLISIICPPEEGCEDYKLPVPPELPVQELKIYTDSDLRGSVGQSFSATFRVAGGSRSYEVRGEGQVPGLVWSSSGNCPQGAYCLIEAGLVFLNGIPTQAGKFNVIIIARDQVFADCPNLPNTGTCPMSLNRVRYGKASFTVVIQGQGSGTAPVINGVKGPTTLKVGEEGIWTINASDPNNSSLSYSVVWGDEQILMEGRAMSALVAPYRQTTTFYHAYASAGEFTPVFRVANDQGLEAKTSISVRVGDGGYYGRPTYGVEPSGTLVRGQAYNLYGTVTGAKPNSRVYFFLQRPDGTIKYDNNNDILAGTNKNNSTDANGNFSLYTYQAIANEGQNGTYTSWVSVGGMESNRLYHNVVLGSSVQVLSPNGGETWTKGTTQTIKWQDNTATPGCPVGAYCVSPAPKYYDIQLFSYYPPCTGNICPMYYPMPETRIIAKGVSGFSYEWTIPNCTASNPCSSNFEIGAGSYTIQICQTGSTTCDSSDSYFKIVSGSTGSNHAPIIGAFPVSANPPVGQLFSFTANATDADNDNLSWSVNWGESGPTATGVCPVNPPTGTGQNWNFSASHTWMNAGSYNVTVYVNDCRGGTAETSFTVNVGGTTTSLTITTNSPLPNAKVGTSYEATIKATGGTVSNYGWSRAGSLPPGLAGSVSIELHDYKIIGTPTTVGTYTFILTIASGGNSIAKTFTLTVDPATGSGITLISPNGGETLVKGTPYTIQWTGGYSTITDPSRSMALKLVKEDGVTQVGWIQFGNQPSGSYSWDPAKVRSAIGYPYNVDVPDGKYKISAIDYNSPQGTTIAYDISDAPFTIVSGTATEQLTITTSSPLPNAKVGQVYSAMVQTNDISYPISGYLYSVTAGSLPPGLSLGGPCSANICTGIAGTPTTAGTYTFTLTFTVGTVTASKQFILTIDPLSPITLPLLTPQTPEQMANTLEAAKAVLEQLRALIR